MMDNISSSMPKGLKKYWRRRSEGGYQRVNNGSRWWRQRRRRRNEPVEQLGSTANRRRGWRIKISPKIRISRIPSPKKMLTWLRDAYVRMMLGVAHSRAMSVNASVTGYGGSAASMVMSGPRPKEYDEKMIIHIYKSLMMQAQQQGHLLHREVPCKISS